jgi:hypothetical protein
METLDDFTQLTALTSDVKQSQLTLSLQNSVHVYVNVIEVMASLQKPTQKGLYVARIELVVQRYHHTLKHHYDIQTWNS